jgi:hypothetical protein
VARALVRHEHQSTALLVSSQMDAILFGELLGAFLPEVAAQLTRVGLPPRELGRLLLPALLTFLPM